MTDRMWASTVASGATTMTPALKRSGGKTSGAAAKLESRSNSCASSLELGVSGRAAKWRRWRCGRFQYSAVPHPHWLLQGSQHQCTRPCHTPQGPKCAAWCSLVHSVPPIEGAVDSTMGVAHNTYPNSPSHPRAHHQHVDSVWLQPNMVASVSDTIQHSTHCHRRHRQRTPARTSFSFTWSRRMTALVCLETCFVANTTIGTVDPVCRSECTSTWWDRQGTAR